jgi:hypothetical protein
MEVVMSDMRDPLNPRDPMGTETRYGTDRDPNSWGWILGGLVAVAVVLAVLFSFRTGDETASNSTSPAATTGQSSAPSTGPATANRPTPAPAENTGSR